MILPFYFSMNIYAKIVAFAFCFLILPVTAFSGEWRKQQSKTLAWLHAVYFSDAKRGWIAGSNGTLLITNDGGETWKKAEQFTEDNLRDVVFTDNKNGWLLAERDVTKLRNASDARSYLLKTNNGGANWERVGIVPVAETNPQFTRLLLSDDRRTIWIIGELGSVYALSENSSWQKQISPTRFLLRGGAIFNEREAIVAGSGATIMQTADGGKLWRESKIFGAENARFNSVFFATRTLGWAVGSAGKILSTTDGGKIWRSQNSPVTADLLDVRFTTPNEGWAIGDAGILLRTTNSGLSWKPEQNNSTHRLERLFFIGRERGFAVGFGGTILAYSNQNSPAPRLPSVRSR